MVEISTNTLKENMKEILDSNDVIGVTRHGFLGHVIVPVDVYESLLKLLEKIENQGQ
jgi:hypothetical protein|tara:strand:- start:832 stop:1002 length:171 start_codon:yes stop_codon:yes gene_type:complete